MEEIADRGAAAATVRIEESVDGTWIVLLDGAVVASGLSNAAAWREADRGNEQGQPNQAGTLACR